MGDTTAGLPVVDRKQGPAGIVEGCVVLVDKPSTWSSFKVVRKLRKATGIRKIGHAGTLDPMATGLLICCVGRAATRRVDEFMGLEKEYEGTLRLGESTASYDSETDVQERKPADHVTWSDLQASASAFVGDIDQVPPMYSAIQVKGRRLYDLARKGKTIDRPARRVNVVQFELIERTADDVRFRVVCSKGTYIRSLAHDLGASLGVGAHLVSLRRTRIGTFGVDDAINGHDIHQEDDPDSA